MEVYHLHLSLFRYHFNARTNCVFLCKYLLIFSSVESFTLHGFLNASHMARISEDPVTMGKCQWLFFQGIKSKPLLSFMAVLAKPLPLVITCKPWDQRYTHIVCQIITLEPFQLVAGKYPSWIFLGHRSSLFSYAPILHSVSDRTAVANHWE